MNRECKNEILSLLSELEKSKPDPESAEGVTIEYLKCFLAETGNRQMGVDFFDFKRFWLESVPWCSELSSRIEKIIIMKDEFNDQETHG
ncbi:MAG: hypothetical protein MUE70_00755 [Desulfobacterales bacterium]|nr:hypothetical protein [Desulfobacterales bacterium]